jgi:hypothetical protein
VKSFWVETKQSTLSYRMCLVGLPTRHLAWLGQVWPVWLPGQPLGPCSTRPTVQLEPGPRRNTRLVILLEPGSVRLRARVVVGPLGLRWPPNKRRSVTAWLGFVAHCSLLSRRSRSLSRNARPRLPPPCLPPPRCTVAGGGACQRSW